MNSNHNNNNNNNNQNNNNTRSVYQPGSEYSLFVGDLPLDCTDDTLQRLFQSKFKSVRRVQIIKNEDGSSRGFGFIRFENQTDFQSALSQTMKINGTTLRLDPAHRPVKERRGRYNSFNSTVSNSSNHHNHHHFNNSNRLVLNDVEPKPLASVSQSPNEPVSQVSGPTVTASTTTTATTTMPVAGVSHTAVPAMAHRHGKDRRGRYNSFNSTVSNSSNHHNHHHFNNSNRLVLNDVEPKPLASVSQSPNEPVSQVSGPTVTASTTTTATTTMPVPAMAIQGNQQNPNNNQQAIGPDLRGYVQPTMTESHLIGAADPPTSVYGHMYPYGPPPPFSYMPPPPQPNPVMPISAVPPAPPNQSTTSGAVGQQHSLAAVNANRFNPNTQQHHHSQLHHHPSHHQHQQPGGHLGGGVDATGLGAMPSGLPQAPHQGPFYYYYPSPLYFDQSGGATGGPPNHLYHPSTFHPQFFAVPGPAYLPNAHSFNQHQPQPPSASQSDANLLNQQPPTHQQAPPQPSQQQSHQQTQQQQTKDR